MDWLILIIGGLLEIGWPLGLKMSQQSEGNKTLWIILSIISMALSGGALWWAQRSISIGTAYAVWTGIGAVGTFIVGVYFFHDPINTMKWLSMSMIIVGIVGLKLG
jgi:quaternary ammonium compound-resistance protein SugE